MAVLKLYTYPEKILNKICTKIDIIDNDIKKLLDDMLETMYVDKGVGLAAPQIGLDKRIIVIDDKVDDEGNHGPHPLKLINPEFIYKSDEMITFNEGCLSLPGLSAEVKRHKKVTVRYLDENAKETILEAEDYLAVILQHEIDHLDGILYIDHLSRLKKNMMIKHLLKNKE